MDEPYVFSLINTVAGRGKISETGAAEGALTIIKLIGMNSTFTQIWEKLKKNKMSENLKNFENLKEKKVKIQPCA